MRRNAIHQSTVVIVFILVVFCATLAIWPSSAGVEPPKRHHHAATSVTLPPVTITLPVATTTTELPPPTTLPPVTTTTEPAAQPTDLYAAWTRVAVCEEGGWVGSSGSAYPDSLGIDAQNWYAYGGGSDVSPDAQIAVAERLIQANGMGIPDQSGCASW